MLKKITFLSVILLFGTGVLLIPVQSGILLKDEKGVPFYFLPWESDEITIGWRHSVELTPWQETYRITDDGELALESTVYQSYGAGTPDAEGKVEFLQNGYIQVTEINRKLPYYSLFYTPVSQYFLEEKKKYYPLSQYIPANTNAQIHYERLQLQEWLSLKWKGINKEG